MTRGLQTTDFIAGPRRPPAYAWRQPTCPACGFGQSTVERDGARQAGQPTLQTRRCRRCKEPFSVVLPPRERGGEREEVTR